MVVLRRTRPDLPRAFRTPLSPVPPAVGIAVYLLYGRRTSLPARR
ncbi:hypothetical protein [Nocardiopsis chromatogenes]